VSVNELIPQVTVV